MKVFVTGATGYIGSHAVVSFLSHGLTVVGLDNLSNSTDCSERIERISGFNFEFIKGDINDTELLEQIFSKHDFDAVIHFAGFKAVGESTQKPLDYYENNVFGTINLLKLMLKFSITDFIFSSSATVYGENAYAPYVETMKLGQPTSPYGASKVMVENVLNDIAKSNSDFRAVSLRYFNPIGAHPSGLIGEDPNGIPNNLLPFITQVAIGKRDVLRIFGNDYPTEDGTCKRDYLHVVDLAEGHLSALNWLNRSSDFRGVEVFNLGTGSPISVLEMVKTFVKETGQIIKHEFAPRRKGDLPQFWADSSKAKKVLGWEARLSLSVMVRDAWNWQFKKPGWL
jgi:UDP-glucose 4-epimerase